MSQQESFPQSTQQESTDKVFELDLNLNVNSLEPQSLDVANDIGVVDLEEVRQRISTLANTETPQILQDIEDKGILIEKNVPNILTFEPSTLEADKLSEKVNFYPRPSRKVDIDEIVEVDLVSFEPVYRNEGKTLEEKRSELKGLYEGRFDKLGGDWMQVVVNKEGKICGLIVCCPTNKRPEDFISWEDTTDNGTLETTYDPNGKYIYVVSLSMLPEGSNSNARDILFANQIGKMIELGVKTGYFESRLPGLRTWVKKQTKINGQSFESLTKEQKLNYATKYVSLKKWVNGKYVIHDRLLRMFDDVGAKFVKVAPDAYQDVPSMNFGVVCVLENPLPKWLQKSQTASKLIGKLIRFATKHPALMKRLP
jgi:hypothetical protein